jgi:hypothetical protein
MTHYTKGTPSGLEAPPTACRRPVSGTVSLPSSGCFSPFPHGTGSLSVSKEYLAFEGGPPMFRQDFTCPALLNTSNHASYTGLSPILPNFPDGSSHTHGSAGPRSLAATRGVSVDFLSSGYLDVSVPRVCFYNPIYSGNKYLVYPIIDCPKATITEYQVGSPIQRSMDQSLFSAPHGLSQSITSFIASYCQGIHQTPFSRLI